MSQSDVNLAKYACDSCRARKIRCTRDKPRCTPCTVDSRECIYSRQGIVHRNRKSKKLSSGRASIESPIATATSQSQAIDAPGDFESQLEADIQAAQGNLNAIPSEPSTNLASLSIEYTSFWQDPSFIEMADRIQAEGNRQFFSFEEQSDAWIKVFEKVLLKGKPWFTLVPLEISKDLAAHPERVRQSAYLVIFYGIMLTIAASEPSVYGEDTIHKMRWNLWLALNDAKLLLEPSDLNIQALLSLLSMHVQDFHTPSLCWMLLTTACRMLQALGITGRNLDEKTKERRLWLFWGLSSLDIALALMFGRPPTFHRAMRDKLPLLDVQRLLGYQPHLDTANPSNGRSSLFGAHFMHRMYGVSPILGEIWHLLYDSPNTHRPVEAIKDSLDVWYKDAYKVLEATQLAEQPLLSVEERLSVDIGIKFFSFQYHYYSCVLLRTQRKWRTDCIQHARIAMGLLESLVSDSNEVYNGVVWALLYCPFTPFFVLLGDVLSKRDATSKNGSLDAMKRLPSFLEKMAQRTPQAVKLQQISTSLIHQAHSILDGRQEASSIIVDERQSNSQPQEAAVKTTGSSVTDSQMSGTFDTIPILNFFDEVPVHVQTADPSFWTPESLSSGTESIDTAAFRGEIFPDIVDLSNMFMQSNFDWFAWDSSTFAINDGYNPF